MLHSKCAVRTQAGHRGVVRRFERAQGGHRWWLVDWADGTTTVASETILVDVEVEEWDRALDGLTDGQRCRSTNPDYPGRRCGLQRGHYTTDHRNCAISWPVAVNQ
jgi:hypothetical protein